MQPIAIKLETSLNNELKKTFKFIDTKGEEIEITIEIDEVNLSHILSFNNKTEIALSTKTWNSMSEEERCELIGNITILQMLTQESQNQLEKVGYVAKRAIIEAIINDEEVMGFFATVGLSIENQQQEPVMNNLEL